MPQYLSKFLYILKGKYKTLLLMVLLFIFVSCLEVIGAGLIGPFISLATNPNLIAENNLLKSIYQGLNLESKTQFLSLIGCSIIVIFLLKAFLSFNSQRFIFEFGFRQQGELAARLMNRYLAAPYTFHLGRNSASLIQNITIETERFSNGVMMPLLTSISNAIVTLALVGLLVKTNAMALIIIGGILIISYAILKSLKHKTIRWGKDSSDAMTEMIRSINHGMGGFKETKVIGCESYFEGKLVSQIERYSTSASLALSFGNLPRYAVETFLIAFLIGFTFFYISTNQGNAQNLSSVLGIFALASIRLLPAVGNMLSAVNTIRYNTYSLDKIHLDLKELENTNTSINNKFIALKDEIHSRLVFSFRERIILDDISYGYPYAEKTSLDRVSLTIKKGEAIGLIGRSGAGKTTLVDVILGLLVPQHGDITVDGASIYSDLRAWQNSIGYVPQSIFLIDDTLERNIAFGVEDRSIDLQRLHKAIVAAQLEEVVEQLPQGLNTMVGERGVLLSGGQRQRVGIARALYHEREILVFDEATAALDNETEGLVTEAIKSLSGIKTMIIIAHRLSTIEHCDRIYELDRGRLVRSGSYSEVILEN
ncbi:ABC transporter ATP-binding protein [Chamaesiphon minutus]|uniref:ABC-type bacteriocin/lantibiotic exporter with N-terminal double-glycine peptidase domain n=1 Tax=Chamaesiphon minutus (strain ATCC 27169 / PCC 6605) TaxID=1173020 RepID=K9UPT0_CHAP6|nr:ABC transporter ATP-binding protein [Chamaesiphon minutus]AFY96800.1 ABC-type bacteriocin/lantibiotic exporter with N-terminal double-glycine peptidase domain [Chamaesiphon minutus PCC 6605]